MINGLLYEKLCKKDNEGFWKAWRIHFCSRNLKHAITINGCSGDGNIRREFTKHFKNMATPKYQRADDYYKQKVDLLLNSLFDNSIPFIDKNVTQDCVNELKTTKRQVACGEHINAVVYNFWFISVYCLLR